MKMVCPDNFHVSLKLSLVSLVYFGILVGSELGKELKTFTLGSKIGGIGDKGHRKGNDIMLSVMKWVTLVLT